MAAYATGATEVIPTRDPARWWRLVLFALFGIAPGPIVCVGLLGIDVGALADLDHEFDVVVLGAAVFVLLASIVLPLIWLRIRRIGPVKIVVDDAGVTEWDGNEVRTSIPWGQAGVFLHETTIHDRRFGSRYNGGVTFAVASDRGFGITTGWGVGIQGQDLAGRRPSTTEFPARAISALIGPGVRRLERVVPDPRDRRRPLRIFARLVGLLYLAALGGAVAQTVNDLGRNGAQLAGLLYFVAGVFAAVRSLRPLVENVRLSREAAPARRGIPMTLVGEAGGALVHATDAHGRPSTLDFSSATHPDAWLARRGGNVFVALEPGASFAGGYRDAPLRVVAVETPRDRRERSRIRTANRLEITARLLLAVLLAVTGGVLLAGLQEH